jgi:type II secretory pathway component PulK
MFQRLFTSLCLALSVASISPVYAAPHQAAMLQSQSTNASLKNSSLGGIKFSMSERQVQQLIGKPRKRQQSKVEQCGEPPTTRVLYTYKNLEVELEGDQGKFGVTEVKTTDRRFRTNKGIRVGDSIKKAQAADPTLIDPSLTTSGADNVWASGETMFLMETNKRGIITSISLGYNSGC